MNVNEAFETLGRELIIASEEKKITKQKQNKKITVAKAQDLNVEKKNGCCWIIWNIIFNSELKFKN